MDHEGRRTSNTRKGTSKRQCQREQMPRKLKMWHFDQPGLDYNIFFNAEENTFTTTSSNMKKIYKPFKTEFCF